MIGCQKMDPERSFPTIQASGAVNFEARYVIPLTDEMIGNGEEEIVDPILARDRNEAYLLPVFTQIITDAVAGNLPTYPEEGMTDPENNPATYLSRMMGGVTNGGWSCTLANLTQRLEIEYTGTAQNGESVLIPTDFDVIYVDLDQEYPDRRMATVRMADLLAYQVTANGATTPIKDYLSGHHFEEYVIAMKTPADTFGVRSFSESQALMVDIAAGNIANLRGNHQPDQIQ